MRDLVRSQRLVVDFVDLLDAAAQKEPWALEALADEYLPRLTDFARARGAADPGGIADVTLMSVFPRLTELQFEVPEQLWAYLCLTARSRMIDEHRRTKPVELIDDPESFDGALPSTLAFDDRIVDRDYVSGLLATLTDEQRQVLELRFLEDLSIEETASLTGRSQGAVKGLQRRAINAIIAAVAVVLVVLAVRGLSDRIAETDADIGPADEVEQTDNTGPDGANNNREQGPIVADGEQSQQGVPEATDSDTTPSTTGADSAENTGAEGTDTDTSDTDASDDDTAGTGASNGPAIRVSAGTDDQSAMNTSGAPGEASLHGVRIRCTASHFSHDDPIEAPGQAGAAPAQLYWGNTAVGADSQGPSLATTGNSTCEGGISDRSAYWMPALFTAEGLAAVPATILIEYKSFGDAGFDRATLQPLPVGLHLVADPAVANRVAPVGAASPNGDQIQLYVSFPSCVQVDQAGSPVIASSDGLSHLSYRSRADGRSNECPTSHPYRIPQLSYRLTYDVPWDSGWYLANQIDSTRGAATVAASAIAGWEPAANRDVVTCVRDLLTGCWFDDLSTPVPEADRALVDASFTP